MDNQIAITPAQIAQVKVSWVRVIPISETPARLFYDRLFETSPQLAPMFDGVDLVSQRQKLVKAINMVVMSLERIDSLIPTIRELGQRHIGYGVEESHYSQVEAALLWTLEAGLSGHWSDDAKAAWTKAHQLLAEVMIDGARQAAKHAA